MNKFWKWSKAEVSSDTSKSELILEGVIASESWFGDEVTPAAFREELKNHPGNLTVRINSPGGDVYAGLSIYNALVEHEGKVTIKVDGIAASIASVVAMAGDNIVMNPGAMMMVHRPWTVAMGNADDMKETAAYLEKVGSSIVPIYSERTGQTEEKINELLDAETYMTAEDAVDLGFADEAIKPKSNLSEAVNNALSYVKPVKAAVMQPVMSLKTKLEHDAEQTEEVEEEKDVSTNTTETTEETVPADNKDDTATEEVKTETDEQEKENPATEEIVETQVTETTKSTHKENNMPDVENKTTEIAATQVLEPKAQATVDYKPKMKDYLKSKESMNAFAQILEEQAGKTSDEVRAAWKNHLETKMGVTNPEIFLPEPLIQSIEDAFKEGGEIWNRVTKTGADVWRAVWDANTDPDDEDGRGRGYNRSVEEEKAEQELTFASRILRPQMIYKYITLNREDVKNQRSTGALVRFVLAELPRRIIREVERAIVIGDGRAPGSAYKIQEGTPEGFFNVKDDADADNAFASTYTPLPGEDPYASVVKAYDLLEADGRPVLIVKKGWLTDMRLMVNPVNGSYMFQPGTNLSEVLEVETIIRPDWFTDTSDADFDAYLVILPNYRVVGDTSIEAFTNFLLRTNKQEYLQEIFAGGGLTVRKTAVGIASTAS